MAAANLISYSIELMVNMRPPPQTKVVDITQVTEYEKYLYKCITNYPPRRYRRRTEYLEKAIPEGFHKKLLILNGEVVGEIEYSPAGVSYYPIIGEDITVMNCIWVLRKAKGHSFGKQLLENMRGSEKDASGFATIALENHWSPWFRKWQIERLGFEVLDTVNVAHRTKYKGKVFSIHLMWMPTTKNAEPPRWNRRKLLEGITACMAHPLYHPQTHKEKCILEKR